MASGVRRNACPGRVVPQEDDDRLARRLAGRGAVVCRIASLAAMVVGGLAIARWVLEVAVLSSVLAGRVPMAVSTGVGVMSAGLALWLSIDAADPRRRLMEQGAAALLATVGLVTLLLLVFDRPGLDQLLGGGPALAGHASRMAPSAALCFILFGLALLAPPGHSRPASLATVIGLIVALLALIGYASELRAFYALDPARPMALNTAAAFVLLFGAVLLAHPRRSWLAAASLEGRRRVLIGHVLPAVLIAPLVFAWLTLNGQAMERPYAGTAAALLALATVAVLTGVIWHEARLVELTETARARSEDALRASEAHYRAILDTTVDAVVVIDDAGTIHAFNPAAQRLFGYAAAEVLGRNVAMLMPEPDRSRHDRYLEHYRATGERRIIGIGREVRGLRRDGTTVPLDLEIGEGHDGAGRFFTGTMRDISQRKAAEQTLEQRARRQAIIAEIGQRALRSGGVGSILNDGVTLVARGFGLDLVEVLEALPDQRAQLRAGVGWREDLIGTVIDAAPDSQVGFALGAGQPVLVEDLRTEHRFSCAAHVHEHGVVSSLSVIVAGQGRPFGVLSVHSRHARSFTADDASFLESVANVLAGAIERERTDQRLRDMALLDTLTRLPNRVLFRDRLDQALAAVQRSGRLVAVLLLDLDHFKEVNDTLGHPFGDRLLVEAAQRLQSSVRATDTVARLGGDEFAVVLAHVDSVEDVAAVAKKIIDALRAPFRIDDHEAHIGASIGIATAIADGGDPDRLLRHADLALYQAKAEGRNTYHFYADRLAVRMEERKRLERDLRRALEHDQLDLHFQPEFSLTDGGLIGAECLLRWCHPELGMIPPGRFVPLAEDSGLIAPLGLWVLERACRAVKVWQDAGLACGTTAVNVSLAQLRRGQLADQVEAVLDRVGLAPQRLELEFTESVFLNPSDTGVLEDIRRLHELGVGITIDDFGTGYSSLGRLRWLPVDKVKLDRSFVAGLDADPDAESITQAVLWLARSLGFQVIAEGIETERQLDALQALGCHAGQGYYFSHPVPARRFESLLQQHAAAAPIPALP